MKKLSRKGAFIKRRLLLENLESRTVFNGDDGSFVGFGSLTYSIAPDGTLVGRETSELYAALGGVSPAAVWEQAIARAFQKWAQESNTNIGRVLDNGAASGVYGPTRGDERFGDIRVTGFDFAEDSHAEAVSENTRSVGTWAGDMFFNTTAEWTSVEAIEATALHEVGHILGLAHSTDPLSAMYQHGPSGNLVLTADDIAQLQAIHGPRTPDPNEGQEGNDTIANATEIKGGEEDTTTAEGFRGDQVWIQFGDLQTSNDRDVYAIQTAKGYAGPISVEVRSEGISLARLRIELTDKNGDILAQSEMSGDFGGVTRVTLDQTQSEGEYFLRVLPGDAPFWAIGDYSVTVANPTTLETDANAIAAWSRQAHRWYYDSDRAKDGFSYQILSNHEDGPREDDRHTDDTIDTAGLIPQVLDTAERAVFQTVGTISDLSDIDHYVVEAPKDLGLRSELTIDVESLAAGGLVPEVEVFDEKQDSLVTETRVKGYGQTELVIANVQPEQKFFIRLLGQSVTQEFRIGSMSLSVTFGLPTSTPEVLLEGTLSSEQASIDREWYVARPQLFGLSLSGTTAQNNVDGSIWVSIFDSQNRLVAGLVAPLNDLRSAPGLFLDAGTYYFQVASSVVSGELPNIDFALRAERPSQPVGPVLGDKKVQPMFLCPGSTTQYCYPNSTNPTTTTQQVGPPPVTPLAASSTAQVSSSSNWYWNNQFAPTNPSNAMDVDGDGSVGPLDVLLVIDVINSRGIGPVPTPPEFLGYLDTNANGDIEPLDVLLVINYLNGLV